MMNRLARLLFVLVLCVACDTGLAATKYWSGAGTWNTANWGTGSGGPYDQSFVSGDSAVFEGTGGAVTLGADITVSNITFNVVGYTISGNTLNFVTNATVDLATSDAGTTKFTCGISGNPAVRIASGSSANIMRFEPDGSTVQTLGQIVHVYSDGSGDKGKLELAGTSTNGAVDSITYEGGGMHYGYMYKLGTGEWTVNGNVNQGRLEVSAGTLIINGTFASLYSGLQPVVGRLGGDLTMGGTRINSGMSVSSGGILSPGDGGVGQLSTEWGTSGSARTWTFNDDSIYEWDLGATTNDTINIVSSGTGGNAITLDLNNFVLKIRDTGGNPVHTDQIAVFTYTPTAGYVTVDTNGFGNTTNNFDTSEVPDWEGGTISLVDDGAGTIYVTGLNFPVAPYVFLDNTSVASNAPPGAFVGNVTMLNTNPAGFVYSVLPVDDYAYFDIASGSTNLRTDAWLDKASFDITILGTNSSTAIWSTNSYTITATPAPGIMRFEVKAEVNPGVADGSELVGILKADSTDPSAISFSLTAGRTDLFEITSSTNLTQVSGTDPGALGTVNYVEVKASNASLTRYLLIGVEVVSPPTTGTIFTFY